MQKRDMIKKWKVLNQVEERAKFSACRTFARFALVWVYLFPLPFRVQDGLQLEIGVLPGLFLTLFDCWYEIALNASVK